MQSFINIYSFLVNNAAYILLFIIGCIIFRKYFLDDLRRWKKKVSEMEFTKTMYIYNVLFVAAIVVTSFITVWNSGRLGINDIGPIGIIDSAAFAELALHTGFVIWKAKFENGRKYRDVNLIADLTSDVSNKLSEDISNIQPDTTIENIKDKVDEVVATVTQEGAVG